MAKPQRGFKVVLADNRPLPFRHLERSEAGAAEQDSVPRNSHPFGPEIRDLIDHPAPTCRPAIGRPPRPGSGEVRIMPPGSEPPPMEGEARWVDTLQGLEDLRKRLERVGEFGVDTEQHSRRSFLGFTALLQMSTEEGDYLVDAMALHDHLHILRGVFANPNITKVFHGADSDCLWLQRDYHIYVVNLFDTARACSVLGKPHRSLAYLLQAYCGITANKEFQRADWRERPLTPAKLLYARTDAHFLLYIAARLRWELLQADGAICQPVAGTQGDGAASLARGSGLSGVSETGSTDSKPAEDSGDEKLRAQAGVRGSGKEGSRREVVGNGNGACNEAGTGSRDINGGGNRHVSPDRTGSGAGNGEENASGSGDRNGGRTGNGNGNGNGNDTRTRNRDGNQTRNLEQEPNVASCQSEEGISGTQTEERRSYHGTEVSAPPQTLIQAAPSDFLSSPITFKKGGLYEQTSKRSNTLCLNLYQKDASAETAAASLLSRHYSTAGEGGRLGRHRVQPASDAEFRAALWALCEWRDATAREEDESLRFVLSDAALLALASSRPTTEADVLACVALADGVQLAAPDTSTSSVLNRSATVNLVQKQAVPGGQMADGDLVSSVHKQVVSTNSCTGAVQVSERDGTHATEKTNLVAQVAGSYGRPPAAQVATSHSSDSCHMAGSEGASQVSASEKPQITMIGRGPSASGTSEGGITASGFPSPSPVVVKAAPYLVSMFSHIAQANAAGSEEDKNGQTGSKLASKVVADLSSSEEGEPGSDFARDKNARPAGEKGGTSWVRPFPGWSGGVNKPLEERGAGSEKDWANLEEVFGPGQLKKTLPKSWQRRDPVQARQQFIQKFSCRKQVYENCRIYSSGDERLLCFCDKKKLEWYVHRGLAEYISEDPPSVRLLFQPKGRPEDAANEFYIQSKSNRCVACGESGHYLRYRLVPSCYRQHFPEHLKSHRSHDIVLLCVDCHEIAHKAAEKYKRKVAVGMGVPLIPPRIQHAASGGGEGEGEGGDGLKAGSAAEGEEEGEERRKVEERGGVDPLQLRRAAMAVLKHGDAMPQHRLDELLSLVRQYYGTVDVGRAEVEGALLVGMGPRGQKRLLSKAHPQALILNQYATLETQNEDNANPEIERSGQMSTNPAEARKRFGKLLEAAGIRSEGSEKGLRPGAAEAAVPGSFQESGEEKEGVGGGGDGRGEEGGLADEPTDERPVLPERSSANDTQPNLVLGQSDILAGADFASVPENRSSQSLALGLNQEPSHGQNQDLNQNPDQNPEQIPNQSPNQTPSSSTPGDSTPSLDRPDTVTQTSPRPDDSTLPNLNASPNLTPVLVQTSSVARAGLSRREARGEAVMGHGRHGKQVVQKIWQEGGEEGVRQFIQTWREVFVAALQPRFLPPGWDVQHKGHREFGDYSVYNPERREADPPSLDGADSRGEQGGTGTEQGGV